MRLQLEFIFGGALFLLSAPSALAAYECQQVVSPGEDLQQAIDATPDYSALCLTSGDYLLEAALIIDHPIALAGPWAGVSPFTSQPRFAQPDRDEARLDGLGMLPTLVEIASDEVVLDGLEIMGGTGDLIASSGGQQISGVILQYLLVHDGSGDEGIQLRACTACSVTYSHLFDIAQDAINFSQGSDDGLIAFNEIHDSSSENAAVYVYGSSHVAIVDNHVYRSLKNDGIKLGSKDGSDAYGYGGRIEGNQVDTCAQDGISVYMSDTLVSGNDVTRVNSENGAIYVAFNVDGVVVSGNYIYHNGDSDDGVTTYGIRIGKSGYSPSGVTVTDNCLESNEGGLFFNALEADDRLSAVDNWWGDPSGPSGAGPGQGDSVSTAVDFQPWRIDGCPLIVRQIEIDVRPSSPQNLLRSASRVPLPVALLSSPELDLSSRLEVSSLTFGRTGTEASLLACPWKSQDVNGDGFTDVICLFLPAMAGLAPGSSQAVLLGQTLEGMPLRGTDSVKVLEATP